MALRPRPRRLTVLARGGEANWPIWSPDGQQLAFSWLKDGQRSLAMQSADGTSPPQVLLAGAIWPSSWSPDGRHLVAVACRRHRRGDRPRRQAWHAAVVRDALHGAVAGVLAGRTVAGVRFECVRAGRGLRTAVPRPRTGGAGVAERWRQSGMASERQGVVLPRSPESGEPALDDVGRVRSRIPACYRSSQDAVRLRSRRSLFWPAYPCAATTSRRTARSSTDCRVGPFRRCRPSPTSV